MAVCLLTRSICHCERDPRYLLLYRLDYQKCHICLHDFLKGTHFILSKSKFYLCKQDSRGAKFDVFGGPGCDDNDLSRYKLRLICELNLKTFFKQFLVDETGITENWVNIKAILERKD